ncbi:MAG TPA: arginase family protein [Longimicrobiales bacterium]
MPRDIVAVHAPSPLGLKPPAPGRVPGVWRMPEALREAGLHAALGAKTPATVQPPDYIAHRDPVTRVRNHDGIARYSVMLADVIQPLLNRPEFVLVLGGDCSIFVGIALALRRTGRFGVVYIDAHSDCQTPEISGTGGIAGMPLAIATGRGVPGLANLESRRPFIHEDDVVLLGVRDLFDVVEGDTKTVDATSIRVRDLTDIRATGPAAAAGQTLADLESAGVDGIWVHLDVDVLDPRVMPAVDSPDPGGLFPAELVDLLRPLLASPVVRGMQVTIYDPERDPDARAAAVVVDVLTQALARTHREK